MSKTHLGISNLISILDAFLPSGFYGLVIFEYLYYFDCIYDAGMECGFRVIYWCRAGQKARRLVDGCVFFTQKK